MTAVSRNAHNQGACVIYRERERVVICGEGGGGGGGCVCEHLCVSWRPKVHPRANELGGGRCRLTSRKQTRETHTSKQLVVMPEETSPPDQARVSFLSTAGHEGSLSFMSLFVLFQSAASSDGGEYIFFYQKANPKLSLICPFL